MARNDFYGNNRKSFIGIVKDIQDPKDSGRVRLWIHGVHPEEGISDYVSPQDSSSTGSGSSSGTTGSTGGGASTGTPSGSTGGSTPSSSGSGSFKASISVDESKLPDSTQLSQKISKHFTLAQLTVGAVGSGSRASSRRGIEQGKLTKEIIANLARLATNVLDPVKDHYGNMVITSGWRIGVSRADVGASRNHPSGFACDFSVPGVNSNDVAAWVQANLKGRYNFLMTYKSSGHLHVQLGSNTNRQGSTSNPVFVRNG